MALAPCRPRTIQSRSRHRETTRCGTAAAVCLADPSANAAFCLDAWERGRMSATKSLKDQNAWLIRMALVAQTLAFAYVVLSPFPASQFLESGFTKHLQEILAPG